MTQHDERLTFLQAFAAANDSVRAAAAQLDNASALLRPMPGEVFADPGLAC